MVKAQRQASISKSVVPNEIQQLSVENSPLRKHVPFASNWDGLKAAAQNRRFSQEQRSILKHVLLEQYKGIKLSAKLKENIEALSDEKTFTVTTGHQVCFLGGPLYFVIKLASVVKLAQQLQEQLPENKIVPVFWMATEDHDFEEANHVFVQNQKFSYSSDRAGAVGRIDSKYTKEAFDALKAVHPELEMSSFLLELEKAYLQSSSIAEATRKMANAWFGSQGLVCIDADHADFKKSFSGILERELKESFSISKLEEANEELGKLGMAPQIQGREINLFYLSDNERSRIERSGDKYKVSDREFSYEELISEPVKLSPNVVLRPLYQEFILPNLAYVGGPAELKYWLQLTHIFKAVDVDYPVLVHRDNFMFLKDESYQFLVENGLGIDVLWKNFDEIEKFWVDKRFSKDEEWLMWKKDFVVRFEELSNRESFGNRTKAYIPAGKRKFEKILEQLEKRIYRDHKFEVESELRKWHEIKEEVFPLGTFQERLISVIDIIGLMGPEPFESFVANCDPFDQKLKVLLWTSLKSSLEVKEEK